MAASLKSINKHPGGDFGDPNLGGWSGGRCCGGCRRNSPCVLAPSALGTLAHCGLSGQLVRHCRFSGSVFTGHSDPMVVCCVDRFVGSVGGMVSLAVSGWSVGLWVARSGWVWSPAYWGTLSARGSVGPWICGSVAWCDGRMTGDRSVVQLTAAPSVGGLV